VTACSVPPIFGRVRKIRYEKFVKMTGTSCNKGQGQIIQFGLMMDQFVPKLKACLDPAHRRPFWIQHYLGQRGSCVDDSKATFSWPKDFFERLNPEQDVEVFSDFENNQLSPICDFDVDESVMALFYVNADSEGKVLHEGNWKALERELRDVVNKGEENFVKVITGAVGNSFLAEDKFAYPKYFFKVVVHKSGENEVYIGDSFSEGDETVCENVVSDCGWADRSKGRIYCCGLDDQLLSPLGLEPDDLLF
jgi:hypothetical protein